jgi:hypothetical protein
MARPEKPHMGKLALPFMNSRMLLLLTSWSMRCWVSLICVVLRVVVGAAGAAAWMGLFHSRRLP